MRIAAAAITGWLIGLVVCVNVISYRQSHPSPKMLLRR
jgi:hypothetical protein